MGSPLMCEWVDRKCKYCGYALPAHLQGEVLRNCTSWRAGDDLESALAVLGITKDRYVALKEALHLAPSCNCEARQEWLNKTSVELQVQVDKLRKILKTWYSRPR